MPKNVDFSRFQAHFLFAKFEPFIFNCHLNPPAYELNDKFCSLQQATIIYKGDSLVRSLILAI
jgi:hypothetical protein